MLIEKTWNFTDNNYKLISEQLKYVASKYESLVKINFHEKTWGGCEDTWAPAVDHDFCF